MAFRQLLKGRSRQGEKIVGDEVGAIIEVHPDAIGRGLLEGIAMPRRLMNGSPHPT
jgi:hypothetical protein